MLGAPRLGPVPVRTLWSCLGLLLLAGVAAGEQGLRLPLTLSWIAVRRDSWAGLGTPGGGPLRVGGRRGGGGGRLLGAGTGLGTGPVPARPTVQQGGPAGGASAVPGPLRPALSREGRGLPASRRVPKAAPRLHPQPGVPEPWSPQVAFSPPWWSWATLSPWLLCGTGAGGAGRRRMSKVSRWRLLLWAGCWRRRTPPLPKGAGGGAGARGRLPLTPAFPCSLPFLSLSWAAAHGRGPCLPPCPGDPACCPGRGRGSVLGGPVGRGVQRGSGCTGAQPCWSTPWR